MCMYTRQKVTTQYWSPWLRVATIIDIPSSLPANGGNADTLGGKPSSDFVVSTDTRLTNARTPLAHTHSYEPVISTKNSAFNQSFESSGATIMNYVGNVGAKPGTSTNVARADHTHGMPNIANYESFGYMSKNHVAHLGSLFTVIAAGVVYSNGAPKTTIKGSFNINKESTGVYWVGIPGVSADLAIATATGNFSAMVFNKTPYGFNVRTLRDNYVADAEFTFAAFKF